MTRTLGIIISISIALICTEAAACGTGPWGIFSEDVPPIEAPNVVEVTIVEIVNERDLTDMWERGYYVGIGRVERVIKGEINSATIKVLSELDSCEGPYSIGAHGIVVGNTRKDGHGVTELIAIAEPMWMKRARKFPIDRK